MRTRIVTAPSAPTLRYARGSTEAISRAFSSISRSMCLRASSRYGAQWRVEISSSNFPRFDRNLNTGGNNFDETKGVVARNTVHHSRQYPSAIKITVVRKKLDISRG